MSIEHHIASIQAVEANAEQLYSEQQVEAAIDRMGEAISQQLAGRNPLILCLLNGGVITTGRLLMRLNFPLTIDSINATRYRDTTSGSEIEWRYKPRESLAGRTVLLVDDVLDEGITLAAVSQWCREQGAVALYSAVLIEKELGHEKPCQADFVGLHADNRYLFGYGMDYQGYLRNASGIFACRDL